MKKPRGKTARQRAGKVLIAAEVPNEVGDKLRKICVIKQISKSDAIREAVNKWVNHEWENLPRYTTPPSDPAPVEVKTS